MKVKRKYINAAYQDTIEASTGETDLAGPAAKTDGGALSSQPRTIRMLPGNSVSQNHDG